MHSPSRDDDQAAIDRDGSQPPDRQITAFAYHLWTERGCPIGSPDGDWFQAEAELKTRSRLRPRLLDHCCDERFSTLDLAGVAATHANSHRYQQLRGRKCRI